MWVVTVLLPVTARNRVQHERVRAELAERFGGVTGWVRAPARGAWRRRGRVLREDVAAYEVLVPRLGLAWWRGYRRSLERRFHQEQVLIRAQPVRLL